MYEELDEREVCQHGEEGEDEIGEYDLGTAIDIVADLSFGQHEFDPGGFGRIDAFSISRVVNHGAVNSSQASVEV